MGNNSKTTSKADRAEELFRQGYNCSQSVFSAFADELGMSVEESAKLASPFGAGFGKLREVCGAVCGMTMLVGAVKGYSDPTDSEGKKALYELEQKMCAEFEAVHKTIICRELLGLKKGEDLEEPAVRTEEYYKSRPCVSACRTAAEIAEKYLFAGCEACGCAGNGGDACGSEGSDAELKLAVTYSFASKDQRDGFADSVRSNKISEIVEKEPGCIRYEYVVPEDNDLVLMLYEEWESEAHQKVHLETPTMGFLKAFKLRWKAETSVEKVK